MGIVVVGACHSIACGVAAGNYGNFLNGIAVGTKLRDYCVPRFMVCRNTFIAFGYYATLFLRTHKNFIYALVQIDIVYQLFPAACRKNSRLV